MCAISLPTDDRQCMTARSCPNCRFSDKYFRVSMGIFNSKIGYWSLTSLLIIMPTLHIIIVYYYYFVKIIT
jgi:hypothetical protein